MVSDLAAQVQSRPFPWLNKCLVLTSLQCEVLSAAGSVPGIGLLELVIVTLVSKASALTLGL